MPRNNKLELTGIYFRIGKENVDLCDCTDDEVIEVLEHFDKEQIIRCICIYNESLHKQLIIG